VRNATKNSKTLKAQKKTGCKKVKLIYVTASEHVHVLIAVFIQLLESHSNLPNEITDNPDNVSH